MTVTVSTRLEKEEVRELEELAEREGLDRASVMKQLLRRGMREALWQEAVREYRAGRITLSRAAEVAQVSLWDLIARMPEEGLELSYGVEELDADLETLSHS
jgi:predicted HTH domain antitoxin